MIFGGGFCEAVALVQLLDLPDFSSDGVELLLGFLDAGSDLVALGISIFGLHEIHTFNFHLLQVVLGLVVFIGVFCNN